MTSRIITFSSCSLLLALVACDANETAAQSGGDGIVVVGLREGPRPLLEVELQGETRLVAVDDLSNREQGVTIQDADEALLAAAHCHDDEVVLVDVDPESPGLGGPCDACELDPITQEVLDAAAAGELGAELHDDGVSFRKIQAYQWCQGMCVLAYPSATHYDQTVGCLEACAGAFCPIGCF